MTISTKAVKVAALLLVLLVLAYLVSQLIPSPAVGQIFPPITPRPRATVTVVPVLWLPEISKTE